jgi:hypothetical protein
MQFIILKPDWRKFPTERGVEIFIKETKITKLANSFYY